MAAKKANQSVTTNNKYSSIFKSCPYFVSSEFEQQHFASGAESSIARHAIKIINQIRKIDSDLETETRTFERNVLESQRDSLYKFLDSKDLYDLEDSIKQWESDEQSYWTSYLGKIAAIEVLTNGKPSIETMSKMVMLPEDMYIEATQICVKLANAIKEATVAAEESIGVVGSSDSEEQPTRVTPTKLKLKKVK